MKKVAGMMAVALLACATPGAAEAQCNDGCVKFVKTDGSTGGYGCVEQEGSGQSCIATTTRCSLADCKYALLLTPEGEFAGTLDECAATESVRAAGRTLWRRGRLTLSAVRQALAPRLALRLTRAGSL